MNTPYDGSEIVVAARVSHSLRDLIDEIAAKFGATRSEMAVAAEAACQQAHR